MPLGEFDLIARYFSRPVTRGDVALGVGDDAALLTPPSGQALVAAVDTIVEGRHFLPGTPADAVGHQALAVNLSDLAAMGADPAWALLSLSLPEADEAWLEGFARGLYALADRFGVGLVGGDTVAGPRVITVTVMGFAPVGEALRRSGAQVGDVVFVSGVPGLAAEGLKRLQSGTATFEGDDACVRKFLWPEPRLALGRALRGVANAAMDVSDGLLGDLGKLAQASGVGVVVDLERLPLQSLLDAGLDAASAERQVLHGGDDYELVFTVPAAHAARAAALATATGVDLHRIGEVTAGGGVQCRRNGQLVDLRGRGHDHFAR